MLGAANRCLSEAPQRVAAARFAARRASCCERDELRLGGAQVGVDEVAKPS